MADSPAKFPCENRRETFNNTNDFLIFSLLAKLAKYSVGHHVYLNIQAGKPVPSLANGYTALS
jgi:hypothetical protein